jgi:hypothetical protein
MERRRQPKSSGLSLEESSSNGCLHSCFCSSIHIDENGRKDSNGEKTLKTAHRKDGRKQASFFLHCVMEKREDEERSSRFLMVAKKEQVNVP